MLIVFKHKPYNSNLELSSKWVLPKNLDLEKSETKKAVHLDLFHSKKAIQYNRQKMCFFHKIFK